MARNEVGFKGAKLVGAVIDTEANPDLGGGQAAEVAAADVTVAAHAASGIATGDVQATLQALATRITELETATEA